MKPSIVDATMRILRSHFADVLRECIDSFSPDHDTSAVKLNEADKKSNHSDDLPDWVMELDNDVSSAPKMILDSPSSNVANVNGDDNDIVHIESEQQTEEGGTTVSKFARSRLKRRPSGFDKDKERRVRMSEIRNEVIRKDEQTFDLIADDVKKDEYALSRLLSDLMKFETSRIAYPKSNDDVVWYKPETMTSCDRDHNCNLIIKLDVADKIK